MTTFADQRRAVAQERDDAAKQRDEPNGKYGQAENRVKNLVPDLLVGRPPVNEKGKNGRHKQRAEPEKPRVSSQNSYLVVGAHSLIRRWRITP